MFVRVMRTMSDKVYRSYVRCVTMFIGVMCAMSDNIYRSDVRYERQCL